MPPSALEPNETLDKQSQHLITFEDVRNRATPRHIFVFDNMRNRSHL